MRNIRPYLLTVHLHPSAGAKEQEEVERTVRTWVEKHGGEMGDLQFEGKRKLAYEIGHTGQVKEMGIAFSVPARPADDLQLQISRQKQVLRFRLFHIDPKRAKKTLADVASHSGKSGSKVAPKEKASIEKLDEKIDEILDEKIL